MNFVLRGFSEVRVVGPNKMCRPTDVPFAEDAYDAIVEYRGRGILRPRKEEGKR